MKLKDFLPFEEYVITSSLSVEQVILKLNENVAPKSDTLLPSFTSKTSKPYKGEIDGNRFTISRIISYKNSFLPVINGDIITLNGLTNINIKMNPNVFVLIFWYVLITIIGGAQTALIINNNSAYKDGFPFGGYGFVVFIGIFLVTPLFAFKNESRKSKRFLSALFESND